MFFGPDKGILPVSLSAVTTNDSDTARTIAFYATSDGGETWILRLGLLELQTPVNEYNIDIVSPEEILVANGASLFASHNGAQSWRAMKMNLQLTAPKNADAIDSLDFVDARHGWIRFYGDPLLYQTSDGGKTCHALPCKIVP